ncbi:MAG: type II secretion system major pseudopilin GspG [Candidatus Dadabacteria bacterium]|nr:type II secretion system major pseudopilin GspG [Candidatus Dadabacteria bacterium]NIQ14044.1 type II secretion system major pseudopilin GspG [Candidatus Dadabacteria bacterium]
MNSQSGFTLIEIMVVVLIIAGLAYIVGTNVIGQSEKAKREQAGIQIKQFESSLKFFKLDNGFYPETQQGLRALIEYPTTGREAKKWNTNGYLDSTEIPLDPWNNEFIYIGPDQTQDGLYELRSIGEDGISNTDDDISSRDTR